jgi:hypothetical protein
MQETAEPGLAKILTNIFDGGGAEGCSVSDGSIPVPTRIGTRTVKQLLLILAVVLLAAGTGIGTGRVLRDRSDTPVRPAEPSLHIPAECLDFGEVWETERFEWMIPVENRGSEPVAVGGVAGSCECVAVEPQQFTLGPGERTALRLTLDLRDKPEGKLGANLRPFHVFLVPIIQSEPGRAQRSPEWRVSGQVRPVLVAPRVVSLGAYSELAQPLGPWAFRVEQQVPLRELWAATDQPGWKASVRGVSGVGDRVVEVTPPERMRFERGDIRAAVTLRPVAADGTELPSTSVGLMVRVLADIQAEPSEILAAARSVNETFEETVFLRSLTGTPFRVEAATAEGDGLSVEAGPAEARFQVRQRLTRTGQTRGMVRFTVATGGRTEQVTVPVVGLAVPDSR